MKIKLLESHEIEKPKWDDLISESREGNVYALYNFLLHCERNWKAVVLMEKDMYLAAIPLQFKTTYFSQYIYQDPFAHELGLFCRNQVDGQLKERMIQLAFNHQKFVSSYLFNVENSLFLEKQHVLPKENLFQRPTIFLDLERPYQEVYHWYSTNRKRDLKKALKFEQSISSSTDVNLLLHLFKKYTAPKIDGIEEYQYPLIKDCLNQLLQYNIGELYHVEYDGQVVSAVFITRFKNKIVFLFGAHSEKALHLRSSTLVLDHIIRKYSGQDYVFDFEGSEDPHLAKYYSSFGAKRVYFYEYRKNDLPWIVRVAKNFRVKLIKSFIG